ncbi:MAG: penicillin acylase family protein [Ignavibacteriales bacterium]|nr:penicillin acylase family protein [Ignavibacteriales bacterium]
MANWFKLSIGIFVSTVVLISAGIFLFYLLLQHSLPDYNGEKDFPGLSNKVEIYRDDYGIPYIFSQTDEDAAFALGYVHAQERLFQMDIARRAGEGKLSEIFGSKTLAFDMMFKTIGMDRVATQVLKQLNRETKNILEAYSEGVNAYIQEYKGMYAFEFDVLQYDPEPWKPEQSLLIGKLMAWELNISWWTDIAFSNLVQSLGEEKVKEILPDYPENAPTIIPSAISSYSKITTGLIDVEKSFRTFMGFKGTHIGSNNWVVNATKSASGKPIIANDPHLAFQAPGKWYAAVIRGKDWKTEGVTLPGIPAIVIGKNQNISWVLTNVMADDADFYNEHIDSTGKKYLFNGNWMDLKTFDYRIHVKDSSVVKITVKETHRGPIVSDIHLLNKNYPVKNGSQAVMSMRWTGLDISNELPAFYSINKAKNWIEFKEALKNFSSPGQNFVYADKEGNIGYVCAAKLPIRNSVSPTFIYDGSTDINDWKGFVPFEQMPTLYNPPENFIATANNKTVKNFPYHISNLWEPPSRITRINELLNSKPKLSINDFKNFQMDFISPYAREITPFILSAFQDIKITDINLNLALELLKKWNFAMDEFSQVPAIYNVFFNYLLQNIFEDEMGKNLFQQYIFIANVPYRTVAKLLKENSSTWFDNTKTPKSESRDDIIRKSLADALTFLERKYGSNLADWQWGNLHQVVHKHMFHGKISALDNYIDVGPYNVGGDGTTIFNTEYSFNQPYENILGPSMRYLFDFSKPEEFQLILPTGESGNIFSNHYKDMSRMWLTGKYITINTNEDHIRNAGYKLLILK